MAITINGSGTVTGLAVGGLPDGTVDSDTLATDSVVTGKIADGTIANADINNSAAIAGSKLVMPTGSVLQVVSDTHGAQLTLSTAGAWVDTGLSLTITPSSTSSKIHLQYAFPNVYFSTAVSGVSFRILRSGSSIFTPAIIYERFTTHNGMHLGYANIAFDSPSTTSAITYKVQAAQYNSNVVRVNDNGGTKDTLIAMEIAG